MKTTTRQIAVLAAGVVAASVAATLAHAQDYPAKPVQVIIPYGPGSNSDTSGRILLNAMQKHLGQELVPVNVAGAGGTIGAAQLANAEPDGYTLGFNPSAPTTLQPQIRPLPYGKDSLATVCLFTDNPTAVTVAPDSPYNTFEELVAAAKEKQIVAAGPAPGSVPHITQAAVSKAAGVEFTYLPAGGGGASAKAVLGGEATLASDSSAMGAVHGLKTLAVAAGERLESMPDVPTLKELGYDVELSIFNGLYAPAGTPEEVLSVLSDACEKAVEEPDLLAALERTQYILHFLPYDEFQTFFNEKYDSGKDILSLIGLAK